jgi:hypothetical protein
MSLDHITVKTTDEYETQTDNSDSPSENKRTKFTNTRHINPELKILMHSQQQLKSKDFLWCVEKNQPLWMGITTNVHCLKDMSNSQIYYRFKRGKQKDCYKTYPILKVKENEYTNCDSFNYNFFGHKHGILQNDIIPDYKISRTIDLW